MRQPSRDRETKSRAGSIAPSGRPVPACREYNLDHEAPTP